MTSEAVASKPTQIVRQSRQLSLFKTLLRLQLVHLGLEPSLLLPELLVLEPLLLKLQMGV